MAADSDSSDDPAVYCWGTRVSLLNIRSIRARNRLAALSALILLIALVSACQPLRGDEFDSGQPKSLKPVANEIILTVGRRYGVAASGTGVQLRTAPDPSAATVESLRFATVVTITAEASGSDGKTWRRVDNRGWATRDGLFVFTNLRDAMNLAIELRVYSSPTVRASLSAYERPPARVTPSAGAAPGKVQPGPTRAEAVSAIFYGIVLKADATEYDRPGENPSKGPTLDVGFATTVTSEGIGADGLRYNRLENNAWVRSDLMAVFATLPEATGTAYSVTMAALSPGVEMHPNIAPALWILHREAEFRYLANAIRDARIPIRVARISDPAILSQYNFADRTITFSERAQSLDVRVLAATLAHEANHVWEAKQGVPFVQGAPCFEAELRSFRIQARVWETFFSDKGKEAPADDAEIEQNEIARLFRQDSEVLKSRLLGRYAEQCGYRGPLPASVSLELTPRTDATPVPRSPSARNPAQRPAGAGTPVIVGAPGVGTPISGLFVNPALGAQPTQPLPGGALNPDSPTNRIPSIPTNNSQIPGQPPVVILPSAQGQQPSAPDKIPGTAQPTVGKPIDAAKPPSKP